MKTTQNHYPSLFSSILFVLGALLLFSIALLMGVAALASAFAGTGIQAQQTVFLVAFGFEGIILLTAAFFSFQKFLQTPSVESRFSFSISYRGIAVLALVACVSLLIGYWIRGMKTVDWFILPILTIPAVIFPLVVLLSFGTRELPFGTRWQTWSVLGFGMTLAPLLLFALEIFIGLVIFSIAVAYIMTQPGLSSDLQRLSEQIIVLGPQSQAALHLLVPFLLKPGVIVVALLYISVLVPAIEEIFKPIGVWLLAARLDSPAQGFTLGALSGAAYGLIETIGVSGQTGEWASLLFTRIGTGLLHITTSALMGSAIVLAWRERRYLRLFGTYLLAVFLHGFWNSLAILYTFSTLTDFLDQPGWLGTIQPATIAVMAMLAVGLFAILLTTNLRMRKMVPLPIIEPTSPSESQEVSET